MTNSVRNISKNQILQEDIALGLGEVEQTRRGIGITGNRLAVPLQVADLTALALLDPVVANLALIPSNENSFDVYLYKDDVFTGAPALPPNPGTWVPQRGADNKIISETPPLFPTDGLTWVRCADMREFLWYVDVDGGQWIESNPSYGAPTLGVTGTFLNPTSITIDNGIITSIT